MLVSFVICTNGQNHKFVETIIQSIVRQKFIRLRDYEVIVIGGAELGFIPYGPVKYIPFDENIRPGHITRKKNLAVQAAKYDNVVLAHDYLIYDENWYINWCRFPDKNFDVAMNRIENTDGSRYRDLCAWDDPRHGPAWRQHEPPWTPPEGLLTLGSPFLPPYSYDKFHYTYLSGGYFIGKRQYLLDNPQNEELVHGLAEDVWWSREHRDTWRYVMNPNSITRLLRWKERHFPERNIL